MPTYEYVCRDCDSPLEVVQSIHDASLTDCPQCDGSLRKVFGNVGVVFKGSGFYRTDNRSKKGASGRSLDGRPGKSDAKSGDSKSGDSKSSESKSESSSSSSAKSDSGKSNPGTSPKSGTSEKSHSDAKSSGAKVPART